VPRRLAVIGDASASVPASIPRVAGGARKRDGVTDVGEAGDVGEGALKPRPEPACGTVP
jgi:hypothetical protein